MRNEGFISIRYNGIDFIKINPDDITQEELKALLDSDNNGYNCLVNQETFTYVEQLAQPNPWTGTASMVL